MHGMAWEMLQYNHPYEYILSRMKSPGNAFPLSRNRIHCPGPVIPRMIPNVESPVDNRSVMINIIRDVESITKWGGHRD